MKTEHRAATPLEFFYDLVSVVAITYLTSLITLVLT